MGAAAVSWSGGKDSYLAMHLAWERGDRILYAVNMHVENRVSYHGPRWLLMAQVGALGVTGVFVRTTWEAYERDFKALLKGLRELGVDRVVFGDIYIEEHRRWVERVCSEVGLEALEPLWGVGSRASVERALRLGVKALIVRAYDREPLSRYVGRILDWDALEELEKGGVDPAGERGEYHTVVLDAPLYSYRIEILGGVFERVEGDFGGRSYSYRVFIPTSYRIEPKAPRSQATTAPGHGLGGGRSAFPTLQAGT